MAEPTELPEWNTTEERTEEPNSTQKSTGWVWTGTKFEKPKGETFNWWMNNVYKWILFFKEQLSKPVISGTATLTNATNNINLVGVGALDNLQIGDVIQLSGFATSKNNSLFTVEVITDNDNIIVNQAHAGGTTLKSLTNESNVSNATVQIHTKRDNASIGLGQGWVNTTNSRSPGQTYTNNTGRSIQLSINYFTLTGTTITLKVDGVIASNSGGGTDIAQSQIAVLVPGESEYIYEETSLRLNYWAELR